MISALLSVILFSSVVQAAPIHETEITLEREVFPSVQLKTDGATVGDTTGDDDIVVFDRGSTEAGPDFVVDLMDMTITPEESGWNVKFSFKDPLPADPHYPINFDLLVDKDGDASNNATTGVFRAGSDLAFLLLFGTKTKWHTLTWQYDSKEGRWFELTTPVTFEIGIRDVTMHVPAALLPLTPKAKTSVRAFALTSDNAITATDIAPGKALPPVLADDDVVSDPTSPPINVRNLALPLMVLLLLLSGFLAWKHRK